jgi:hypothetical protein
MRDLGGIAGMGRSKISRIVLAMMLYIQGSALGF